ncbi:hypothetical protein D3C71_1993110 [compost metagenome]
MLIYCLEIRQHLARMREIAQSIDDRNRSVARQILDLVMAEGADHDAVEVPRHNLCRIGNRLAAPQLNIVPAEEQGVSAQLVHANLEGYPGAG